MRPSGCGMPFERVEVDLIGPLAKSAVGFWYILLMMDYAIHFPEAVPLRSATTWTVAAELLKIFTEWACLNRSSWIKEYISPLDFFGNSVSS